MTGSSFPRKHTGISLLLRLGRLLDHDAVGSGVVFPSGTAAIGSDPVLPVGGSFPSDEGRLAGATIVVVRCYLASPLQEGECNGCLGRPSRIQPGRKPLFRPGIRSSRRPARCRCGTSTYSPDCSGVAISLESPWSSCHVLAERDRRRFLRIPARG